MNMYTLPQKRPALSKFYSSTCTGSGSVPSTSYLCDFKMTDFFRIINDASVDQILLHPDCLPEHEVEFHLLRASCFYTNCILEICLISTMSKVFHKGTRC